LIGMSASSNRALELAAALAALATAAAVHGQPRVIYVDASNGGAHNGASWGTAYRDLQDALYAASTDPDRISRGIEVRVSQGVYRPDRGTLNPSLAFVLNSAANLSLFGGYAGRAATNPDERNTRRFVSVLSGDLNGDDGPEFTNYNDNSRTILVASSPSYMPTVDGFEISGGNADAGPPAYVPFQGVISTQSQATGAIGRMLIRDCSIVRNRAAAGPVLRLFDSQVQWSRIDGNRSQGSVLIMARQTNFKYCEIRGNRLVSTVPTTGQPLMSFFSGSAPTTNALVRCLVADNSGGGAGVIAGNDSGVTIVLSLCTVANNSSYFSECVTSGGSLLRVRNSIFAGNVRSSAPTSAVQIAAPTPALLDVNSTVLFDNGAVGLRYTASSATPGPVLSGNPMFVFAAGPDGNPATWADNDYQLRPGSPAIDRADSTDPYFDNFSDVAGLGPFDDLNTPNAGTGPTPYVDLGAYEFIGALCPADFNRSGTISVDDIFDFLNLWLAGNVYWADFNKDGTLSTADIFAFLNAWLAGC
jgi:hypothetical protein